MGYWANHFRYKDAIAAGETSLGAAATPEAMDAVVRNTFVQGSLSILFVVLTLTRDTGVLFSEALFGQSVRDDHKTIFASIAWLLFGALLLGRNLWGWRGRIALRWTLAGFVALMLAYVGSRFVIEVVLQRIG